MYDFELKQYIDERECILTPYEYLHICYTCPQISNVKYDAFSDEFEVWTDDRNYFRFKVFDKE